MRKLLTSVLMFATVAVFAQNKQTVNYETGEVKSVYKQANELVMVTHYYKDGTVKETGFFKNGVPEGEWVSYAQNGDKTAELNYQNGKRHGEFRVWDSFTGAYMEMGYADGELIKANKWVKAQDFASVEE